MTTLRVVVNCRPVGAIGSFEDRSFLVAVSDECLRFKLDTLDAAVAAWQQHNSRVFEMNHLAAWVDPLTGETVPTFNQLQKWWEEKHSPARNHKEQ